MTHTTRGIASPLQAPSAGRLSATSQLFYLSCQMSFVEFPTKCHLIINYLSRD